MTEPILLSAERIEDIADLYSSESDRAAGHVRELLGHIAALAATPAKAEHVSTEELPEGACGVMRLCELPVGHEGPHQTSVERAERATPAKAEGLDVERLARAIPNVLMRTSFSAWVGNDSPYVEEIAQRIAAEYARLAAGEQER